MKKLGKEPTVHVTLRLSPDVVAAFQAMADLRNPWRAIMRDALTQYLRRLGKL